MRPSVPRTRATTRAAIERSAHKVTLAAPDTAPVLHVGQLASASHAQLACMCRPRRVVHRKGLQSCVVPGHALGRKGAALVFGDCRLREASSSQARTTPSLFKNSYLYLRVRCHDERAVPRDWLPKALPREKHD